MAAFDRATLERWRALAIVDREGTTVGTVIEFYLDRGTGRPTWALVNTGMFGTAQTFVPLLEATELGDGLQVPYEKRHIKDAPRVDPHDELTPDEEAALFAHYGVDYQPSPDPTSTGPPAAGPSAATGESPAPEPAGPGTTEPAEATRPEVDQPAGEDRMGRAADPAAPLAEEAPRAPGEPGRAPGAPGTLDATEPGDVPATGTDHWREAKLAGERERIAREAAPPEEPSPLGWAKRRLGRLMSGGQAPADPDRDAAERARRDRLGLDDDPRRR